MRWASMTARAHAKALALSFNSLYYLVQVRTSTQCTAKRSFVYLDKRDIIALWKTAAGEFIQG